MRRSSAQVKMGAPIRVKAVRMDEVEAEPRGIGRIYNLGDIQPFQLSQPEAVGLFGGTTLLLGGVFVKGPGGTVMTVLGSLGIGAVVFNILYGVLQQLPVSSAPQSVPTVINPVTGQPMPAGAAGLVPAVQYVQAAAPPPPPPPKPPTRSQSYAAIATSAAPLAAELVKGLVSLF